MGALGDLGQQPRLAHTRVTPQQQHSIAGHLGLAVGLVPAGQPPLELGELVTAADQRTGSPGAELGGERDLCRARRPDARRSRTKAGAARIQQLAMDRDRVGRRSSAELVAQQGPQPVEYPQAFGDVALNLQRLHEQHVAGFAIGLCLDQRPGGPLDRAQLCAAEAQAGPADHLERL
jgi:hypothetical protein